MTFDLKLEQVCPHLVVDEVAGLDSDMVTVATLRPIANSSVELKINGYLVEDPSNPEYGFYLVRDTSSVDPTARKLRFRKPRKATDEYYEVSYYTTASNCRRCLGLRFENDYRYNSLGGEILVQNEMKLVQDVRKIVLTEIGSNQFHTWYGTSIPILIGGKITMAAMVQAKMESDIRTALNRYADTQRKLARALPGKVTAKEMFGTLIAVTAQQDTYEPTAFNVEITFTNRARDLLSLDTTINVPSPESLVYYTQEQDISRGNKGYAG